jgi:hypothetical protein
MPLQNRVSPDGELIATPLRGQLMGNRGGRFHDPTTRELKVNRWKSKTWICCVLSFNNRRSTGVWNEQRYTELFFLDEVTALAAGHRPCMECRRSAAIQYRSAIVGGGHCDLPRFPDIDAELHTERLCGRSKRTHFMSAEGLPDGVMFRRSDGLFFVFRGDVVLRWSMAGYSDGERRPLGPVHVLTPPTSVAALIGGFKPMWHPSSFR